MVVYWNLGRLFNGKRVLQSSKCFEANLPSFVRCRSDNSTVRIADISKEIKPAKRPEYVPRKYLLKTDSQESLRHLKWMLQKDLLSQDIFLVGAPGARRRELALAYLELTERELEFIALSRDTTEADLKQRREIKGGTAYYHDQSAVRAATNGRVLIIEGVEKAERNVLPVLNNLLENREMHLEDGRFLIPASRYDKLLELHSQEELDSWNLVRVSEDFRVIALGLPSPRYPGHPLDPPLRSRFQARHIPPPSFQEQLNQLKRIAPNVDEGRLSQLLSCAHALVTDEAVSLGLPDFPLDNLESAAVIMENSPQVEAYDLFCRFYPYKLFLGKEGRAAVEGILDTFNVLQPSSYNAVSAQDQVKVLEKAGDSAQVLVENDRTGTVLNLRCGSKSGNQVQAKGYVETKYQNQLLSEMLRSHLVSDFCLIGPKGCGKSVTVQNFADLLGYQLEPVVLYQDMTSRDLIQQRTTLSNGDTVWRESPLVEAALQGKLAVLDGVNRIHPSTLAILHRLVHDRELQLHDGKRLVSADRYDEMKNELGKSDQEMTDSGVLRIDPSFRIVALAEPPVINSSSGQWLNSELLSLLLFHEMRPLEKSEELHIIRSKFGEPSRPLLRIIDLAHTLRSSNDPTLQSLAGSLSTRQLLRIAERMQKFQTENAYQAVQRATLAKFLPAVARQALDDCCKRLDIFPGTNSDDYRSRSDVSCSITEDQVRIGDTTVPRFKTSALSKVPDILFYDVPQHLSLLEHLLQDFSLGHNLLLVGNQGVGKNKIADRLLQLLNRPREYIQLHRDTTVQTLTIQPMVRDGRVVYEDSPLVQAVKLGHVLVVDEADKAPTHVTCILKTLIESGEMILSDGRRIVPFLDKPDPDRILLHPDFKMIVLANRPGFPFLGNDFFGALGDLFSCHAVDNPSFENEIQLLKRYGPSVDAAVIQKLVKAFGELRAMADQGLVSYPYSTREVVNVVKHLEKFPNEPLASVVRNVFDFDRHSQEVYDTLVNVLHKHGIPLGTRGTSVALAREISLPETKVSGSWRTLTKSRRQLPVEERYVKLRESRQLEARTKPLDLVEARSALFTELQRYWTIVFSESGVVAGLTATRGVKGDGTDDRVHVLTTSPLTLHTGCQGSEELQEVSIHGLLSPERGQRPFYSLAPYQGHQIVVHEETTNSVLLIDTNEVTARSVQLSSFLDQATDKISNAFRSRIPRWTMRSDLLSVANQLVFFVPNSNRVEVLDFTKMAVYSITLPFSVQSLLLSKDKWLLQDSSRDKHILRKSNASSPCPNVLEDLDETSDEILKRGSLQTCSKDSLHKDLVSEAIQQRIDAPNRLFVTDNVYAAIAIGFPDLDSPCEVHCWPRRSRVHSLCEPILMENGQIVRTVMKQEAFEILGSDERRPGLAGYLEVVDTARRKLRYIPVPEPVNVSPVTQWIYSKELPVYISRMSDDNLVTVDAGGCVRFWESSITSVERSLDGWRRMLEDGEERVQQLTKERHSGLDVSGPKRGQVDPDNQPHVGGNTWAGGTGGRDTAGLGGKGGPYRLDAGHTVHQLSDQEKNAVPEDIKRAAREMGQRAFQNRLKEIRMSEYDHNLYAKFSNAVQGQVQALRVILGSLQAKSNERQWCRHQTSGELDDTKLIEGLTGERTIYRRRAEREPEIGAPPLKPKRLRLVVDVSGSMYRFNGYDGRLDRELEACVMVMEAFHGYEGKFRYDVVGHSGDDYRIRFVDQAQPPGNNKKRLEVIKTMHAHSQFCMSGDHTLEATQHAINALAKEDTDESIVVVLSDANLERYGIPAQRFARILTSNPDVNAYAIFIGSLGDQAARLIKQMPSGRAFVCMDLKDIPRILQQIFAASVLSTTKSS